MLIGLVKTLFFLITFYYLFKIIGRLLFPFLMKKGVERMQQQQQAGAYSYQEQARQEEGKVTVNSTQKKKPSKPFTSDEGEYVDYEEVK